MKRAVKRIPALLIFAALATAFAPSADIVEGNASSPVRVTIYGDLQCDYCQTFRTMLDEKLLPRYGAQVAFIHRDLPLGRHDWARSAAMAARWVYEQNPRLGIVFRRELLAEQEHVTRTSLNKWVLDFADRNKLSEVGITNALTDPRLGALIDGDVQMATVRNIKKIPYVVVDGQTFAETIVYDDVAKVLDHALSH